jgi:ribosomal protein S18 acetylase RimI-like enzyme
MNLSFTTDVDVKKTNYPDFMFWLDKVDVELNNGTKQGVFCYAGGTIVGAVIYQRHKTCPEFLELKNLTVLPEVGRRFVASFLLRNAEVEGRERFRTTHVWADSKKGNVQIDAFLLRNGYRVISTMDLYGLKAGADNVYTKELRNN